MSSTNDQTGPPEPPPPAHPTGKPAAPPEKRWAWPIGCWVVALGPTLLDVLRSIFKATLLTAAVGLALVLGVAEWVVQLVKGRVWRSPSLRSRGSRPDH
jgi:hypothetical protein